MIDSSKAIMFLAAERQHTETDWHRSYATFSTAAMPGVQKPAFGQLYRLDDDTLAAGQSANLVADRNTCLVLLPIVGRIIYQLQQTEGSVEAGEAAVFMLTKRESIRLTNPFGNELVNYLQIWLSTVANSDSSPALYAFDLSAANNQFIPILHEEIPSNTHGLRANISIGKFTGRAEAVYSVGENRGLFVFVLQGAFEVQYRLLESRDGLALWDVADVEVEALSNEAIVLLIELEVNV